MLVVDLGGANYTEFACIGTRALACRRALVALLAHVLVRQAFHTDLALIARRQIGCLARELDVGVVER